MTEETETDPALDNLGNLEAEAEATEGDEEQDQWVHKSEADQQAAADEAAKRRSAEQGAAWAVGFMETMVTMKYPYVAVDQGTKGNLEEKFAAVLYKHGGGLPPWLEPYREEIELGIALGTAGFVVYVQVAQHEAEQNQDTDSQGDTHEDQAA